MAAVAKTVGQQSMSLAEKGAAQVQQRLAAGEEFHYLDASKTPCGPVTREELNSLYGSGAIDADTHVLRVGTKTWQKYQEL